MLSTDKALSARISNGSVFAAMMVVAYHTAGDLNRPLDSISKESFLWWFEALGHWGVCNIAVPFFFVCSGYFLARHIGENGWWRRECTKRVNSLLVPYVAWCVIFAFLPIMASVTVNLLHGSVAFPMPELSRHFWIQTFGLSPFCSPGLAPLWYLRTLFVFVVISPILWHFINYRWGGVFLAFVYVAALAVGTGMLHPGRIAKFFFCFLKLEGLIYFYLGMWLRTKGDMNIVLCNTRKELRWLALGIGLLLVLSSTAIIWVTGRNYTSVARVVFIPPLLFAFWHFVPSHPFPKWLTANTFAVFLIHGVVLRASEICVRQQVVTMPQWFVKWAIAFFGSITVAIVLRKFVPSVARVLFGGR